MKKILLSLFALASLTLARADFTSITLVSQSDPLTYLPTVSYTFDTLSINMNGNSGGAENLTTDGHTGAVVTLSFTDNQSIVGDTVQLAWLYPNSSTTYEYFPSVLVPGTEFLGSGAGNFTVDGSTITIQNLTQGWSPGDFNGFVLTDLTRQANGPSVPDGGATVSLLGAAIVGLAALRRRFAA